MDITSFVLGLVGIILSWMAFIPTGELGLIGLGFFLGLLGFIFALVVPKDNRNQLSLAGFFLSLMALVNLPLMLLPYRPVFAMIGDAAIGAYWVYLVKDFREEEEKQRNQKKAELAAIGAYATAVLPCLEGLPVPEGTPVQIYDCVDGLRFQKDNREWSIRTDQVLGIDISEGRTLSRGVSAGRVVGGWLLAGGVGAILSSMPKTATALVITYLSQSKEEQFLVFQMIGNCGQFVLDLYGRFQHLAEARGPQRIQL